jgi:hypothetical protein
MAFRLGDLIIAGVIYHSRPFCVHGRLLLRGGEMPISVELTGIPSEDLRGRSFEFEVPRNDRPPTDEDRATVARFCNQQIGPVGDMTAALKRKTFDCSVEEFCRRSRLGDPPPVRWCRCLYLEWYSQNGRVVIELLEPELRFLDDRPPPDLVDDIALAEQHAAESGEAPEIPGGLPGDEFDLPPDFPASEEEPPHSEDEGYGLIPDDLNRELERSARQIDREIAGQSEEPNKAIQEFEMLDDLIEHGEGTLIPELLESLRLPAPSAELSERQALQALSAALGQLALFGVAFNICEHCSIQDAYRIFMQKVCAECTVFPQMRGTSCVQHFTTSDFCERCRGE